MEIKEKELIMPRGDGTGPMGQGKGASGGQGKGAGGGQGQGSGNKKGRMGGVGAGPGGNCVCPSCGEKVNHQQGVPCVQMQCPKCGAKMIRKF